MRRGVDLRCQVVTARRDEPIGYHASDLSLDGMWLETAEPLRSGETVVVCFEPVDGHAPRAGRFTSEMLVFARVVRVQTRVPAVDPHPPRRERAGMALEMLDLTAHERQRLGRWLSEACEPTSACLM
jgi:hypothetical protein